MKNNDDTGVMKTIARALVLTLSMQSVLPATAYAQTEADPNAGAGRKPIIETAGNGATVVHIAPANASGISHNLFSQFNVGGAGLVLNNSASAAVVQPPPPPPPPWCKFCGNGIKEPTASTTALKPPPLAPPPSAMAIATTSTSTLAGAIGGNVQFGGNSAAQAGLIVNEITGLSNSNLDGSIEVFGAPADVVVANANGISCNGCGFINTTRASLVTGNPNWAGTALDGFNVTGGQLSIGAAGLNGFDVSALDLIAGSLRVDGGINLPVGNSAIYTVLGPNQVHYATWETSPQLRSDALPPLALDLGAAAGMYAERIFVLATEAGAGVNSRGRLEARNGPLHLDAQGNLTVIGSLKSSGAESRVVLRGESVSGDGAIDSGGSVLVSTMGDTAWNGGLVKGHSVMFGSNGNMTIANTALEGADGVLLTASGELNFVGSRIVSGAAVGLKASGDLSLQPVKGVSSETEGSTSREFTRYIRSEIDAAGPVTLMSESGLALLDGAQIKSGANVAIQAKGVAMLARKDLTKETIYDGNTSYMPSTERLVQTKVVADGDVALLSTGTGIDQGKIFLAGAKVESINGDVSLLATSDIDVAHDITTDRTYERFYEIKRSWFNKRVTDITKTSIEEMANPSDISGRTIGMGAGGNLYVVGSMVLADRGVALHADGDVNLLATLEAGYAYESRSVKKSGIFGNGGLSFTIGSKQSTNITSSQETRQASSSVASLGGDVLATAGGQYLQMSSDIVAPLGSVSVTGQNITLQSNNNTRSVLNIVRERQSGFTLSATNPLVAAAQTVSEINKIAKRTENGRYQSLALLTSGMTIFNQFKPLAESSRSLTSAVADAATQGWNFSLALESSRTDFESLISNTTPIESSINAGRDVSLVARTGNLPDSGDINLIGSRIIATDNVTLAADRDITLTAAVGADSEKTKRTSSSAAVGISIGFGESGAGVNLNVAASRSNAWSNGWGTTFWNSELTAGKLLHVDSGRDLTLNGAKATGATVLARVGSRGTGDLHIVSPQDESFYQAREQSYGFNVSIPIYGGGSAPPSLGLSASSLKLLAENESVKQQSSIVAGTGGYDVRVNGHTHLRGAAIASKADPALNYFETQTLTHEDVVNRDVASGKSWSISLNVSNAPTGSIGMGMSSVGFARLDTEETFTTVSSVGSPINLTRPDLQVGKVEALKAAARDPLAIKLSDQQVQLQLLLAQEPPDCDDCAFEREPIDGHVAKANAPAVPATRSGPSDGSTSATASKTKPDPGAILAGTSNEWRAWLAAVEALQSAINATTTQIAAVDAKVYQDTATLSNSPSGLHQPLLHTFDQSRATQELRDGVAVTAAFAKTAYKTAGDYADAKLREALTACPVKTSCAEADRWKDGGLYRGALHTAIGGMAFGTAGATGNLAATTALASLEQVFVQMNITDPTVKSVLSNMVVTIAGAAAGSTAGAAAAFNADANNRQLHRSETDWIKANRAAFVRMYGGTEEAAEERLANQAFRQVQFGVVGTDDPQARAFLGLAPKVNLPGDTSMPEAGIGYMFQATPEQRISSAMYLNNVMTDPRVQKFYRDNNITQPTLEQIMLAAEKFYGGTDKVKKLTIVAAALAGGLVLSPAIPGTAAVIAAEAAEFKAIGAVNYCLMKMQNCAVAAETIVCAAAGAACPMNSLSAEVAAAGQQRKIVADSFVDLVATLRGQLPAKPRTSGNMAAATIMIDDVPAFMAGSSKLPNPNEAQEALGLVGVSAPVFNTSHQATRAGDIVDAAGDPEALILTKVANILGDRTSTKGSIILFSELPLCGSCQDVVKQFRARYPNIKITVYDNGGRISARRR